MAFVFLLKLLKESLGKLEKIAQWFEKERVLDVEEGLTRVKEGMLLVKELKARLKETENEFNEIRKELVGEEGSQEE